MMVSEDDDNSTDIIAQPSEIGERFLRFLLLTVGRWALEDY